MRRILLWLVGLGLVAAAAALWITRPKTVDPALLAGLTGDAARGQLVFAAGGCASCHAAPGATGEARLVLAGGQRFASAFGTFLAPNISPSDQGIGGWTLQMLADAMVHGTSPDGQHYYPAFPYTSYARADVQDIADLHSYLATLPPADTPSQPHELGFPFNIRLILGGWKLLFADQGWVVTGDLTAEEERGRYLAESLGHCGECHTPRNALGGPIRARWLGGAPNPAGQGEIPNITPAKLAWSTDELAEYFTSGFTPEYDSAGGQMAEVVENLSQLPEADRAAIAAYLKKVPGVE